MFVSILAGDDRFALFSLKGEEVARVLRIILQSDSLGIYDRADMVRDGYLDTTEILAFGGAVFLIDNPTKNNRGAEHTRREMPKHCAESRGERSGEPKAEPFANLAWVATRVTISMSRVAVSPPPSDRQRAARAARSVGRHRGLQRHR